MALEPRKVEMIAAGTLRWRPREIRVGLERGEELRVKPPGRTPRPVTVEGLASVMLAPCVEQCVAGPRVEAAHRSCRREIRDVGNAAEINDDAMPIVQPEQGGMQRGDQRRALPSRRNIATAEIGDDGNARRLGEPGGVGKLGGVFQVGTVTDSLAMDTDRGDLRAPDP